MRVYCLKTLGNAHGMALVAAPTFIFAKNKYLLEGACGEMYYYGEFDFDDRFSEPVDGLEWHGDACVISESIHVE